MVCVYKYTIGKYVVAKVKKNMSSNVGVIFIVAFKKKSQLVLTELYA